MPNNYYKLSLLRQGEWEEIYFKIDDGEAKIVHHAPQTRRASDSKLIKLTREEVDRAMDSLEE